MELGWGELVFARPLPGGSQLHLPQGSGQGAAPGWLQLPAAGGAG